MTVRTAESQADLQLVWRLTHDVYVGEGYATPRPDGMLRHYPHLDLIPQTVVFMVEDDAGRLLGSNSYTMDSPAGLHADDDFKDVIDDVRAESRLAGKRLAGSWRIVTRPGCREQLAVAMQLISATLAHAWGRPDRVDRVLFTFNPKHEGFYGRMLGLKTIAGPRQGRSVRGAPAILMRGEMSEMVARWERVVARRSSARLKPEPVAG